MQGLLAGSAFPGSFQVGCTAEKSPQVRFFPCPSFEASGKAAGPSAWQGGSTAMDSVPVRKRVSLQMRADGQVRRPCGCQAAAEGEVVGAALAPVLGQRRQRGQHVCTILQPTP